MQQSQFDVVFLTQGLTQIYPPYEDLRTVGSEAAIRFAAAQNLAVSSQPLFLNGHSYEFLSIGGCFPF